MTRWSVLVATLLTAGCTTTVDGRGSDAGAPPDRAGGPALDAPSPIDGAATDAPSLTDRADRGACRWTAGEPVTLSPEPGDSANRTLLDLESAEGGAWLLTSDDAGGARAPTATLERLDASGRRRPGGSVRLTALSADRASLVVDEALGHRAILEEARATNASGCAIQLLTASGAAAERRAISLPVGGFSLAGCRELLSNAQGFTFVSEQIRALWGISLVQLDRAGETATGVATSLHEGYPEVAFTRVGLPDRSFAMMWSSPASRTSPHQLHVRRFNSIGAPLGDVELVRAHAYPIGAFALTPTQDGLVAAWEEEPDARRSFTLALRPLESDGRPRGPAVTVTDLAAHQGGLAMTAALGDVLVASIAGSGVHRVVVRPFTSSGTPRGEVVSIAPPAGAAQLGGLRIVATPEGALVVFTTEPLRYPNQVVAVPLRCAR